MVLRGPSGVAGVGRGAGPSRGGRQGAAGAAPDDSRRPRVGEGGGTEGARIDLFLIISMGHEH